MTPLSQSTVTKKTESRKRKSYACEHGRQRVYAKTAEEVVYANMIEKEVDAKTAEEVVVYANLIEKEVYAKTAEVVYANMIEKEVVAKSARN